MLPKKRGTGDEAVLSYIQEGNFKLYIHVAKIVLCFDHSHYSLHDMVSLKEHHPDVYTGEFILPLPSSPGHSPMHSLIPCAPPLVKKS